MPQFVMSTRPHGADVYEMVVTGADSVGVLHEISGVVSDAGVNFVLAHGQMDEGGRGFVHAYYCEFAGARVSPEELAERLRKLPFVAEVRMASMEGMMFEKFMFPMTSVSADRRLTLGAVAFAEMEDRLVEIFGTAGETMSYEQGKAYAESTVKALEQHRRSTGAEWDIYNIEDLFRAEGWGVATVKESPEGYDVRVKSAPAAPRAGSAKRPGKFVVGLLVGMLGAHSKGHLAAGPVEYDAKEDECRFSIKKAKRG